MPCVCIKVYHVVRLNTCTLHHSAGSMFEINFQTGQPFFRFKLNFQILKLFLRFQISSNGVSRDRNFGHQFSCRENLVLLSFAQFCNFLYIFWGKCVYFSIFEWLNLQLKLQNWAKLSSLVLREQEETKTRCFAPKSQFGKMKTLSIINWYHNWSWHHVKRICSLQLISTQHVSKKAGLLPSLNTFKLLRLN